MTVLTKNEAKALRDLAYALTDLLDYAELSRTNWRQSFAEWRGHDFDRNAIVSALGELGLFELDDGEEIAADVEGIEA